MTEYRIPRPIRAGPAEASTLGAERWACGVAASDTEWPADRFTWRLRDGLGLPLYCEHREEMFALSGPLRADVGSVRRLADIGGLVVCLIEVTDPAIVWDLAEGRWCGLSVMAHVDEPPGGGPAWVYFSEVSLTDSPVDKLARVVSLGRQALADWATLTGEDLITDKEAAR